MSSVHFSLSNWVDPVFGANLYHDNLSTGALWTLGTVDGVIAVVGVFVGLRLWSPGPTGRPSKGRSSSSPGTSTSSTTR